MSDRSGGFFSSVGRFFSGGGSSKRRSSEDSPKSNYDDDEPSNAASPSTAPPAALLRDIIGMDRESINASNEITVDTTQNTRVGSRLRYLSPSALDKNRDPAGGLEVEVNPEQDIFFNTPSVSTNRKRQLTELDRHALPQSFRSETVKRSRQLNRSLLEPTLKGTLNNERRMDMSWCGELTGNHSPASSVTNFSLLSRHSGATTNGSLSSRTQEIFKRLEDANTPAKEVQRMTMLRAGLARPESWETNPSRDQKQNLASTATPPPPLRKAGDAIPSRIQLISKSMGLSARRTPYWKDLTRNKTSLRNGDSGSETSSLLMLNGNLASAQLSSIFSLDPPAPKKTASSTSSASTATMNSINNKKSHVAIVKGPDGKSVGRNTFKLNDDLDVEDNSHALPSLPISTLNDPQPLKLKPESAPKRGFLDNLSFSFNAPKDVVAAVGTAKPSSTTNSIQSLSESKADDSDSCESTEKQTSDDSSGESEDSGAEVIDEVKESRPQTSADTISSAEGSSSQSSKDSSPKTTKDADPTPTVATAVSGGNWDCQECFCNWPISVSKCGACGVPRPGGSASAAATAIAPQRQLVSNLASFIPAPASGVKFGFGATSSAVPATTNSAIGLFGSAKVDSEINSAVFGKKETAVPSVTAETTSSAASAPSIFGTTTATVSGPTPLFGQPAAQMPKATSTLSFGAPTGSSSQSSKDSSPKTTKDADPTPTVATAVSGGNWDCQECFCNWPISVSKCGACGVPRPGGSASAAATAIAPQRQLVSNLASFIPAPASGVKFGFGATSSAVPATTNSASGLFGSAKVDSEINSAVFGKKETAVPSVTAETTSSAASAPSIYGTTTATFSGPTPLFGQSAAQMPKASSTFSFGAPTSVATISEVPKKSLFGSNLPSAPLATNVASAPPAPIATTSLFGPGPGASLSSNLFSAKPAESILPSIFNGDKRIQFNSEIGTTTTDGGVPAKRGMFASDPPKLSFGSDQKVETTKFSGFGAPTASTSSAPTSTGTSMFGTSSGSLFGGTGTSNPFAASTTNNTIPTFGSTTTTPFGGSTSSSVFGNFNSKSNQPALSNSSSTALFPPPDSSNPFGGSSTSTSGFNFGGTASSSSSTGQGVFQFGAPAAQATNTAPGGAFQFGTNLAVPQPPAPGSMDNAFSYQAPSNGGRKMALARRRNMQRK